MSVNAPKHTDLDKLQRELRAMKPRQKLYELVKAEMQRRGRWRVKDRGAEPPGN